MKDQNDNQEGDDETEVVEMPNDILDRLEASPPCGDQPTSPVSTPGNAKRKTRHPSMRSEIPAAADPPRPPARETDDERIAGIKRLELAPSIEAPDASPYIDAKNERSTAHRLQLVPSTLFSDGPLQSGANRSKLMSRRGMPLNWVDNAHSPNQQIGAVRVGAVPSSPPAPGAALQSPPPAPQPRENTNTSRATTDAVITVQNNNNNSHLVVANAVTVQDEQPVPAIAVEDPPDKDTNYPFIRKMVLPTIVGAVAIIATVLVIRLTSTATTTKTPRVAPSLAPVVISSSVSPTFVNHTTLSPSSTAPVTSGPTASNSPTTANYWQYIELFQSKLPSLMFNDSASAEYGAIRWMTGVDTNNETLSEKRLVQRFAMSTIAFNGGTQPEAWLRSEPECSWGNQTVICDDTERLVQVDFRSRTFGGHVPIATGMLSDLTFLRLSDIALTGTVPSEVGFLTKLTFLDCGGNTLTGIVPTEVGMLSQLTFVNLTGNQLTGKIPSEIGLLTGLTYLGWGGNKVTGPIPSEVGRLTNLEELVL